MKQIRKLSIETLSIIVFALLTAMPVSGARFPNAIEKRVTLTGDAANAIADLLGLSSSGSHFVSLQLGMGEAWAVYLLKQDTNEKLWNTNHGVPARYNLAELSEAQNPSLTISAYWLDLGTQLPNPRPGYYSFGSPFLSKELDANDPWSNLLRRLKKEIPQAEWKEFDKRQAQRCFTSAENIGLCIDVHGAKNYGSDSETDGYYVAITIDVSKK